MGRMWPTGRTLCTTGVGLPAKWLLKQSLCVVIQCLIPCCIRFLKQFYVCKCFLQNDIFLLIYTCVPVSEACSLCAVCFYTVQSMFKCIASLISATIFCLFVSQIFADSPMSWCFMLVINDFVYSFMPMTLLLSVKMHIAVCRCFILASYSSYLSVVLVLNCTQLYSRTSCCCSSSLCLHGRTRPELLYAPN